MVKVDVVELLLELLDNMFLIKSEAGGDGGGGGGGRDESCVNNF